MVLIIWTREALQDVDDIATFISRDSVWYAKQFVNKLFTATEKLERYPEIRKPLRELPQSFFYKEILFKKYRIIYRFDSSHVYIISVHHSARLQRNNDTFLSDFIE